MNRTRALIISLAVAVVAVAGTFALTDTLALSKQTNTTTDQEVAKRTAQLNNYEASLRKTLAQQPPVLPAAPSGTTTGASNQLAAGAPPRVVYQRPPPIIATNKHVGEEEESESGLEEKEYEGDEGGEADD